MIDPKYIKPENPKLPDWVGWAARESGPRIGPHFPMSDFYTKLSNPPARKINVSLCCWTDLLGFSNLLFHAPTYLIKRERNMELKVHIFTWIRR
jgi:hypothetical protein